MSLPKTREGMVQRLHVAWGRSTDAEERLAKAALAYGHDTNRVTWAVLLDSAKTVTNAKHQAVRREMELKRWDVQEARKRA